MYVFHSNHSIDICWTKDADLNESSRLFKYKRLHFDQDTYIQSIIRMELLNMGSINCSTVLFKRHCIDHVGFFDTSFQNAMDYDLWLRIVFNFRSYYMNDVTALRRRHSENHSLNGKELHRGVIHALNKIKNNAAPYRYYSKFYNPFLERHLARRQSFLNQQYNLPQMQEC